MNHARATCSFSAALRWPPIGAPCVDASPVLREVWAFGGPTSVAASCHGHQRCGHQGGARVGVQLAHKFVHVEGGGSDVLVVSQIQVRHFECSPLQSLGWVWVPWWVRIPRVVPERRAWARLRQNQTVLRGAALAWTCAATGDFLACERDVGRDHIVCLVTLMGTRLPKFHPNATLKLHSMDRKCPVSREWRDVKR